MDLRVDDAGADAVDADAFAGDFLREADRQRIERRLRRGVVDVLARGAELREVLRGRYGTAVSALRFALGRLAPKPEPPARRRAEPEARLTDSEALEVEKTGAQLNDPTLAAALRRLMTKDLIARRQARPAGPGDRREDA